MTDPTEEWRHAFQDLQVRLLKSGALDLEALCARRDDPSTAAAEAWAEMQGSAILVLVYAGNLVYPAFQFTDTGDLRPELASHVTVLRDAGLSPWMTWAGLTAPAALLSGDVPEKLLVTDPRRAGRAVQRYADQHRVEK